MAQNTNRKLSSDILSADSDTFTGLKTIPDYAPSNPQYSVSSIQTVEDEMKQLQTQTIQLQAQLAAVRDDAIQKEWEFHNRIIGAKTSVEAQYGRDSNEVQTVGKKKISDYKRRATKKTENK